MNLGSIWPHLDTDDKQLIQQAIYNYGVNSPKSYLYQHRSIQWDDPKLIFLKLKPVYYALKLYRNNFTVSYSIGQDKIDKIIHLMWLILKKSRATKSCTVSGSGTAP